MSEARYVGSDRAGASVSGTVRGDVAAFVLRKFRAGWRSLSITRDGREVGGILRAPFDRAQWWVE